LFIDLSNLARPGLSHVDQRRLAYLDVGKHGAWTKGKVSLFCWICDILINLKLF